MRWPMSGARLCPIGRGKEGPGGGCCPGFRGPLGELWPLRKVQGEEEPALRAVSKPPTGRDGGRTPRDQGSLGQVHQRGERRARRPSVLLPRARPVLSSKSGEKKISVSRRFVRRLSRSRAAVHTTPELGSRTVYPSAPGSSLSPHPGVGAGGSSSHLWATHPAQHSPALGAGSDLDPVASGPPCGRRRGAPSPATCSPS